MAVGKIHLSERPLQGAVQTWAPEECKWHSAPHAGPKHRKNFQPISNFLGQFSDPCLLLHFLCILWRKALCPPQGMRKFDLFHLCSQCPCSKSHSSPASLSPAQTVPQLHNFALHFSPLLGFVIYSLHSLCYPIKKPWLMGKCRVVLERTVAGVTTTLRIPIRASWGPRWTDLDENDGSKGATAPSELSCSLAGPKVWAPDLLTQPLKLLSHSFSCS